MRKKSPARNWDDPQRTLPSVTVLDITARDREGGLLARPVQWDEETDGKHPVVSIVNSAFYSGEIIWEKNKSTKFSRDVQYQ